MIALPSADLLDFTRTTYPQHHLGIEASTVEQYVTTVNLLNRFCGRTISTRELSEELVVEFLNDLFQKQRAPSTVNSKRAAILALWAFAHKKSLAVEPGELPRMKPPKRLPKAWRLEQMEALITSCYRAPERRGWGALHWVALVLAIYDTGLRISAMLSVRREQLEFERGTLTVDAEDQKDDEEASYALHAQTLGCLAQILRGVGPKDLVFGWPFSKRQIWPQFKQILARAGLPSNSKCLFHRIRRTSASWLESVRPGSAQGHLGHGQQSTTDRYLDREITGAAINAAELLPRFKIAPPVDPQRLLF